MVGREIEEKQMVAYVSRELRRKEARMGKTDKKGPKDPWAGVTPCGRRSACLYGDDVVCVAQGD
jgi:hypothetical protein